MAVRLGDSIRAASVEREDMEIMEIVGENEVERNNASSSGGESEAPNDPLAAAAGGEATPVTDTKKPDKDGGCSRHK